MNIREQINKWKELNSMPEGRNYYGVRTVNDGDMFLWADRMLVNDSGSLIFMVKHEDGSYRPVIAFGAREFVCAFEADNKDNTPKPVEVGWR